MDLEIWCAVLSFVGNTGVAILAYIAWRKAARAERVAYDLLKMVGGRVSPPINTQPGAVNYTPPTPPPSPKTPARPKKRGRS